MGMGKPKQAENSNNVGGKVRRKVHAVYIYIYIYIYAYTSKYRIKNPRTEWQRPFGFFRCVCMILHLHDTTSVLKSFNLKVTT